MSFSWPLGLLALVAVPALLLAYPGLLRRRRRQTVTYSSVALIRQARPTRFPWRRHVPFALVVAALASLGLAGARPEVTVPVPSTGTAVILALDVSGSMCATDVAPNRLAAAQSAVREFVDDQDDGTRIGLVLFSGFAEVTVAPTTDRKPLLEAVDSLTTGRGTTIGAAILKSVEAITEIDPSVPAPDLTGIAGGGAPDLEGATPSTPGPASPDSGTPAPSAVPLAPEIVVLLTDGANTAGIDPIPAARAAASSGVRVYPIGFGTSNPTTMSCTAEQLGGNSFGGGFNGFGGGGPGGGTNYLVADEDTLRQVATITGGTYFAAQDAGQLRSVLRDLPTHVDTVKKQIEISAAFAALAILLLLLAVWAAARWTAFPS